MHKVTRFFLFCSGAVQSILEKCPSETNKYSGIGATVFFTGIFAALAAGYSLYTVFDKVWAAMLFGALWGLMIFNLDRYIVSSMRKQGNAKREFLTALPRVFLAIIISIVIAKPLELKIFEKEIEPELVLMTQKKFEEQELTIRKRFQSSNDSVSRVIQNLKDEIALQAARRDALIKAAQDEADGTGGSKRRNLGPIYKIKKADADSATREQKEVEERNLQQIKGLEEITKAANDSVALQIQALDRNLIDGPAARIEALDHLTKQSDAIWWAHWFIILLFIAVETAPVFVKLISTKGPYDNLLRIEENSFAVAETEAVAHLHAQAKGRAETISEHEKTFIRDRLDTSLRQS